MTRTRNASPTINGFLFQIDVAIFLMIKYIAEIDKIRVEGEKEDIELALINNQKIMVQVKSQWGNFKKESNVLPKLESALKSLSEADNRNVRDLIYVSNFPNPLKNNDIEYTTYHGVTYKKYSELQEDSKKVIDDKLSKIFTGKIDKEKLWIVRIPFYGEDEDEKHKFIYKTVKEFLDTISDKISCKNFVYFWESKFLRNSSENPKISISKKELSNYLILTCLDGYDASSDYNLLKVDQDDYEEAYEKYCEFIQEKQDCYESICKVNSLYEKNNKNTYISKEEFIQKEKITLYNYFFESDKKNIDEFSQNEIIDMLVAQIITYVILRKRNIIKRINEKVL